MPALPPGTRLGPYEIVAPIGEGGMGQVFKARDLKLHRDAAIKVLPPSFADDADRLARFEREARLLASLNHPHIAHVFGLEEAAGVRAIAMELVEGDDLSQYLATAIEQSGRLPLDEALAIAWQIADALEGAHAQGIIHRDLKPSNIKIRPDGTVKVLDFGLAKDLGRAASASSSEHSPTITSPAMTERGVILGTAAYMSPEQAKGRAVDRRADIWAFGVILYELITGQRLHRGDSMSETIASVLKEEPDLSQIPDRVRPLLDACLKKNPRERLRDIGDARLLFDRTALQTATAPDPRRRVPWAFLASTATLVLLLASLAAIHFSEPLPEPRSPARLQIPIPQGLLFNQGTQASISPDGRWLGFAAVGPDGLGRMYVRSLESLDVKALTTVQVPAISVPPSWSYDSRFIVVFQSGRLVKAPIDNGPIQPICETATFQGAAWSAAGVVVFGSQVGALSRCPASGGTPTAVTTLATGDGAHRWPAFLPDGRHFLYHRANADPAKTGIYLGDLDAAPDQQRATPLFTSERHATFVPDGRSADGWIIFQRDSTLLAQPFDVETFTLQGEPTALATGVGSFPAAFSGLFSSSPTGTLVYRTGESALPSVRWYEPQRKAVGVADGPATFFNLALSPDGSRVAVRIDDDKGNRDLWIIDIARGTRTRLTFDASLDDSPVWTPDGKRLIFSASRNNSRMDLYERYADGSGTDRLLFQSDRNKVPTSVSPDGRYLLYQESRPETSVDIWLLPLVGGGQPIAFQSSPTADNWAQFSPDGRWVAYSSSESGISEVYVRPFDPAQPASVGGKWMVSQRGGTHPRWRQDSRQIFYLTPTSQLMAVDVIATTTAFSLSKPTPLSEMGQWGLLPYGVTGDGKRFYFISIDQSGPQSPFTILLDWKDQLTRK